MYRIVSDHFFVFFLTLRLLFLSLRFSLSSHFSREVQSKVAVFASIHRAICG